MLRQNSGEEQSLGVKRRSRLEIIANILEAASRPRGAGKTHIMFQSNLSNELVQVYLNFLVEKKLVDVTVKSKSRRLFKTNNRGRKYIKKFHELENILAI